MSVLDRLLGRPNAQTIDLNLPAVARNPFPHYERLRRRGSVQKLAKHDAWIVLSYDDVNAALNQPEVFSNRLYRDVDAVLLGADPPDHGPVRRIITRRFTAQSIDALGRFAEEYAASLLSPSLDIVSGYANMITSAVAARLLGIDDEGLASVRRAGATNDFPTLMRAIDAVSVTASGYHELAREVLDADAARSLFRLLWLAATTTTQRAIAQCIFYLLLHPETHDEQLIERFTEEVLRLHPPELIVPRFAVEEAAIGGTTIPEGSTVYLCLAAANRDPARFQRPDRLLLDRPPVKTLTFGAGPHHCVGAALGRRIIHASLRAILPRASHLRPARPLSNLVGWCTKTASPIATLVVEGAR